MPTPITSPLWLRQAHAGVWEYASSDVESLFRSLDLGNPKRSRDVLLREVPQLTSVYGEQSSVLAADWYDELRYLERVPGRYRATMADSVPEAFVKKRIRYGAGHLFTDTPGAMLPFLLDAMQEYVLQPGRDTIQRSSIRDPQASGWARVTSAGACDFCQLLAGRGGVYRRGTASFAAHGNCNCGAVPSWDPNAKEVPASAYMASERLDSLRRQAAGEPVTLSNQRRRYLERKGISAQEDARRQLDAHRGRVADAINRMKRS